jgi:hypothetical protein
MSWFYEAMSEMGEEFDFKGENEYKTPKVIKDFEIHIEKEAKKYMEAHIFNKEALTKDMEMYESIWEYLRDVALDYSNEHPDKVIIKSNYLEEPICDKCKEQHSHLPCDISDAGKDYALCNTCMVEYDKSELKIGEFMKMSDKKT